MLLLASLFIISSLGAALDWQRKVDAFIQVFWRTTASLVVFIPLAGGVLYHQGLPQSSTRRLERLLEHMEIRKNGLFLT